MIGLEVLGSRRLDLNESRNANPAVGTTKKRQEKQVGGGKFTNSPFFGGILSCFFLSHFMNLYDLLSSFHFFSDQIVNRGAARFLWKIVPEPQQSSMDPKSAQDHMGVHPSNQ